MYFDQMGYVEIYMYICTSIYIVSKNGRLIDDRTACRAKRNAKRHEHRNAGTQRYNKTMFFDTILLNV